MHVFSDHLSYCHDGSHLYDLLPLPFTEEMVHHTAQRIREVQDRLGCRIAVENASCYLHSPLAEMNEVEFLNAVAREADCGIHPGCEQYLRQRRQSRPVVAPGFFEKR